MWVARPTPALWTPHRANRPQRAAYLCPADELLYGGSAGGGKSDLLLGLAATKHHNSIIFRRMYPQLEALITRLHEVVGNAGGANFNSSKMIYYRVPGGRRIEFGAAQYTADVEKYQGRPHDLVAFDELTHFEEAQYLYLTGWARTTDPAQRVRVVSASNPPPTSDGYWVKVRWAPWLDDTHPDPAAPGELRWFVVGKDGTEREVGGPRVNTFTVLAEYETIGNYLQAFERPEPLDVGGELVYPTSRTFIPASLADNEFLSHDSMYRSKLQALPEPLRSQLLNGDWNAGGGDDSYQVIPTNWIRKAQARWVLNREQARKPLVGVGVDVARGGSDKTIIAVVYGQRVELHKYPGVKTPDGPSVVALMVSYAQPGVIIGIDVIGIGSSAYDFAKEAFGGDAIVRAVDFSTGTEARDQSGVLAMRNTRAWAYWSLREKLDPTSGVELELPDDPELTADLSAARYKVVNGKITIEAKDDIRKRIGRSPDCGDAVVIALLRQKGLTMGEWMAAEAKA